MTTSLYRLKPAEAVVVRAEILRQKQNGRCALCTRKITALTSCLDHDHKTGLVRGVLCRNCNGIEGKVYNLANRAKDSLQPADWLGNLILYWLNHQQNPGRLLYPTHKTPDQKRELVNKRARAKRAAAKKVKPK